MPTDYQYRCQCGHRFKVNRADVHPDVGLSCPFCSCEALARKEIQWSSAVGYTDLNQF